MSGAQIRVLVVDDEPLGRRRILDLLSHEDGVEVVGEAATGSEAVEAIRRLHPHLVFLDVQMPGMTGLDVVRTIGVDAMPATIFVTAYDQHALQAFNLAALDYLVKPFDDERFEQAFARARRLVSLEETQRLHERLMAVLQPGQSLAPDSHTTPSPFADRIAVESRGKVTFVPVVEIDYVAASGAYAELVAGNRRHLIRESMQSLEDRLDPAHFMRIHRSAIVQRDRVATLLKAAGGDYEVQLKDGTRLRVARSRREDVERWLGAV
ncbi:MAG TPA: LytTR family DNA-binding domain-containing protein [Gemmatimonadaceae bacterium]|nr:LytTR family DNA-binding domain-containing protein [Gemmatimonadaceae bacterium]